MIECNCSVTDFDPADLAVENIRTARKEHICCECQEPIEKGKQYENARLLSEGVWDTYKTCMPCVRIRKRYCPDGWLYTALAESVYNCIGFDYRYMPEDEDE